MPERSVSTFEKIDLSEELPPIPIESVDDWKEIPVIECGEKLVPIGVFSEFPNCDTSAVYFGERGQEEEVNLLKQEVNRDVSLISHFVREGVLEKLEIAQSLIPKGYYFRFWDNFRPLAVQQELYDAQKNIIEKAHLEWNDKQLEQETQKYVSLPSPNEKHGTTHPSPHNTGGVVDLTIIQMDEIGEKRLEKLEQKKQSEELNYPIAENEKSDFRIVESWIEKKAEQKKWSKSHKEDIKNNWLSEYRYAREKADIFKKHTKALNMGTKFDHFGSEAAMRYYEEKTEKGNLNEEEKQILQNRRFLYEVMTQAGFSNYPEEWWHWSYGDNMDAANNPAKYFAIYGSIEPSEKNIAFEKTRRGVHFDSTNNVEKGGLFR